MMKGTEAEMPDFAGQVKEEIELTPEEQDAFLNLEVALLAFSLDSFIAKNLCYVDPFESMLYEKSSEEYENEFNSLVATATPNVQKAIKKLLELQIEWLKQE